MPKIPLSDSRYISNLSVKSDDRNLLSRNEGGNIINVTGELLYIETPTYIYDNTSINNVLKTNFEYYKFPSRIVVVDDVDLGIIPIEELNIEVPNEPIKIRYRLNEQSAPVLLTSEEVEEKIIKNKDTTNTRFIHDGTSWTLESRIEGSFTELEFGTVLEGMPQTLANRFTVTQDIVDRNADLAFNIKIALRMTDNHGRNNYAARLLKYNPDTNKYSVLAQKTSVSQLAAQYNAYVERKKLEDYNKIQEKSIEFRTNGYNLLASLVDVMIRFVSNNEKDANGVQYSDLFGMFIDSIPATKNPIKRRAGYYGTLTSNFWKMQSKPKDYWIKQATWIIDAYNRGYHISPLSIGRVIAGYSKYGKWTDESIVKQYEELNNILITGYFFTPEQISLLTNNWINIVFAFTEMWGSVNGTRGADSSKPEFEEYYGQTAENIRDRVNPKTYKIREKISVFDYKVTDSSLQISSLTRSLPSSVSTKNDQDMPQLLEDFIHILTTFEIDVYNERVAVNKKWENFDRNFIPQSELLEPSVFEHNLEADVINAAADIVSYEKEGLKYAVDAINSYNKLTSSNYKIPSNFEQSYTYVQDLKSSADYKNKVSKLNIVNKGIIEFKFRSQQISKKLGQRYVYEQRYQQAQRQLKSYQNFEETIKLTDLLTYDPAKLGYQWSSDLPYVISINEIIPKSELKIHDSYAVELVTNPAKSIPHQLIEDQTYWTITELENVDVKSRSNETVVPKRTRSVINSAQNPDFNSPVGVKRDTVVGTDPDDNTQFESTSTTPSTNTQQFRSDRAITS